MRQENSMRRNASVVTRIAPSPTGPLHIGTARVALFNYLFAKKNEGVFIVRIEDTDKERSTSAFETEILDSLSWLGIHHDKFYRQSEHQKRHTACIQKLIDAGDAYISKEETRDKKGTGEFVRFKNPHITITFEDLVRGEVSMDTSDLGDFVIARNLADPLHHLAVVVDDFDEGVTHAIRGEDLLSNTPRQILIQEALGFPRPLYAHIPLILASDRSKLSKRHGATAVSDFRKEGYLPEALLNYMALLGWNPGTDQELFSLAELVASFNFDGIQHGGAVFDKQKLEWFNREYLKRMPENRMLEEIAARLPQHITSLSGYNETVLSRALSLICERISTLGDVETLAENGDLRYYFHAPTYEARGLQWKDTTLADTQKHLKAVKEMMTLLPENAFTATDIKQALWPYAEEEGRGAVLWPMRYALSGVDKSPDPFSLAAVLGKAETIKRLEYAQSRLQT